MRPTDSCANRSSRVVRMSLTLFLVSTLRFVGIAPASAQPSVYTSRGGGQVGVYTPATNAYSPLGTGSIILTGLANAPSGSGVALLGVENTLDYFSVSAADGSDTFIAHLALPQGNQISGLALSPGGVLFALVMDSPGGYQQYLYRLNNPTSSSAFLTFIGGTGAYGFGTIGFAPNGQLIATGNTTGSQAANQIFTLNTQSGSSLLLNPNPGFGSSDVHGLANVGGFFYAFDSIGGVYTVNSGTGVATTSGTYPYSPNGPVFAVAAVAPEPNSIIPLFIAAAFLNAMALRRRIVI